VQAKVLLVAPELVTGLASTVQVAPPSRLRLISTVSAVPRLCVHWMFFEEPVTQLTLVLGAVTVIFGAASVKTTLLTSPLRGRPAGLTRNKAWVVTVGGIGAV